MAMNERATAQIYLDGKQAEAAIDGLKRKSTELKQAIIEAGKAGDHVSMKKLQSELKGVESAQRTLKKETFDVQRVLDNLSGASINDLQKAFNKLNAEMKRMDRTDAGFKEKQLQAKALKNELNGVNNEMRQQQSFLTRAADKFNNYFGIITAGAATFAGLILAGKKAVETFNQFEERVSNLSALTGLEGDQLEWLSEKAKETSISTIEGNVRIKQSADAIVDAYTKVGSQRPELLKNKEALHAVTEDAIILSEAAKTELQPAVEGLTMAMNQLGLGADQSRRIINTMAAGSKEGAADIPYLTEAYEKSGTTARLMGIEVEQLTGVIEAIAPSYSKASLAGNSLDKVLLKMKDNNIGYVNGQFNLNAAIEELETRYAKGETAADLFGVEHAKMGEILVLTKNDTIKYTDAVTGTSIALEQAAKNTDNNAAKLAQAQNRAQLMRIELGEKLSPVMTHFTSTGAMMLKVLSAMIDLFSKHGTEILLVAGAIAIYTMALKAKNAESKISLALTKAKALGEAAYSTIVGVLTGKITMATIAQQFWNAVSAINPFVAIIMGVLLLTAGIVALVKIMNAQTAAQKAVNDVTEEAKKNTQKQKDIANELLAVTKDETKSLEERKAALAELNKISPEYFGNLSIEKTTTEELTKAGEAYVANLEKQALIKAAQAKIDNLRDENAEKQVDIEMKKSKWWETEEGAAKRRTKAITENKDAIKALQDIVDKNKPVVDVTDPDSFNKTTTTKTTTGPTADETKKAHEILVSANQKKLDELDRAFKVEQLKRKQALEANALSEEEYRLVSLEDEIFYLAEKEKLYANDADKQLEIKSQLIDKRMALEELLSKDIDALMQEEFDSMEFFTNEEKLLLDKQLADAKKLTEALKEEQDQRVKDEKEAQQKRAAMVMDIAAQIGQTLGETIANSEKDFRSFGRSLALIALNTLQGMVPVLVAQITALSLASPESVATGTAAGWAKSALITIALEAVIAAAKTKVNGQQLYTGGYTAPGGKYEPAGIVHRGEFVASQESVNNPRIKPFFDLIDLAQRNGTAGRIHLPAAVVATYGAPVRGYASGGYVAPASSQQQTTTTIQSDPELKAVMKLMADAALILANKPLEINAREVVKKNDQYENAIKAANY